MSHAAFAIEMLARLPELNFRGHLSFAFATAWSLAAILKMALSVGFRIPVSLLILLPCYGASTSTPVGLSPTGRASLGWTHISVFSVVYFSENVADGCAMR